MGSMADFQFASTPAGWITTLALPVLLTALIGFVYRWSQSIKELVQEVRKENNSKMEAISNKVDDVVTAQTTANTSLAILQSQAPTIAAELHAHSERLGKLNASVAVLNALNAPRVVTPPT